MKKLSIIFTIGLLITISGCKKKEVEVQVALRPVKFTTVTFGTTTSTNEFSGNSQSGKTANLSFRVSGNVVSINVKEGDRVEKRTIIGFNRSNRLPSSIGTSTG